MGHLGHWSSWYCKCLWVKASPQWHIINAIHWKSLQLISRLWSYDADSVWFVGIICDQWDIILFCFVLFVYSPSGDKKVLEPKPPSDLNGYQIRVWGGRLQCETTKLWFHMDPFGPIPFYMVIIDSHNKECWHKYCSCWRGHQSLFFPKHGHLAVLWVSLLPGCF